MKSGQAPPILAGQAELSSRCQDGGILVDPDCSRLWRDQSGQARGNNGRDGPDIKSEQAELSSRYAEMAELGYATDLKSVGPKQSLGVRVSLSAI